MIPAHWRASVGQRAKTLLHQYFADTKCRRENIPRTLDDWDEWQEIESSNSLLSAQLDYYEEIIYIYIYI